MLTFKSDRVNDRSHLLRRWLLITIFIATPLVLNLLVPFINLKSTSFFYYYVPLFSVNRLIAIFKYRRINEIAIDTKRQTVNIKYFHMYTGVIEKTFSFKDLKVKIVTSKMNWYLQSAYITLIGENHERFEITNSKDGFAPQTIKELSHTLELLTSPVSTSLAM